MAPKEPSIWKIDMILFDNLEIFNIVDALTLKQIFWKTKPFLKNLYTIFIWIISIQNYHIRSQCYDNWKSEFKMDVSKRTEFYQ